MKRTWIETDELYPYYFLNDSYGTEVELTDAETAWVDAALAEFDKVQEFLAAKVRAGSPDTPPA